MCLVILSFRQHADFPLVIAANRDEFYARPTAPLAWWADNPTILAGRDLSAGGTWMGVNKSGQFAAVTNYREPGKDQKNKKSRGLLVQNFLLSGDAASFAKELDVTANDYNGYNLLFGNKERVFYFSNRAGKETAELSPGLYGLSNHLLDTPWPKVRKAKAAFAAINPSASEAAFAFLNDNTPAPEAEVQQTGLPLATEKALSSTFIAAPGYGTRVSSFLCMSSGEHVNFTERTFNEGKRAADANFAFQGES